MPHFYGQTAPEREILAIIGSLRDGGMAFAGIANRLNKHGYTNRRGGAWTETTVGRSWAVHLRDASEFVVTTAEDADSRLKLALAVLRVAASGTGPTSGDARLMLAAYHDARAAGIEPREAIDVGKVCVANYAPNGDSRRRNDFDRDTRWRSQGRAEVVYGNTEGRI